MNEQLDNSHEMLYDKMIEEGLKLYKKNDFFTISYAMKNLGWSRDNAVKVYKIMRERNLIPDLIEMEKNFLHFMHMVNNNK